MMKRIAVGDLLLVFSFVVIVVILFLFVIIAAISIVERLALGIINNQVLRWLSGGSFDLDSYLT
jgi:hypothetical protein